MPTNSFSIEEFKRRKTLFAWRGILPMLLIMLAGCLVMAWALPSENNLAIFSANLLFFASGVVFVISAKRYYRCPACEKVVVPTKEDGTPSEISFGIAYKPEKCPYCRAMLR
jgi:hypothetical protein